MPPPVTPSSRSGVGSRSAIARRISATAAAWGSVERRAGRPRAAEPGRSGGERVARPLPDLDVDEAAPGEAGDGRVTVAVGDVGRGDGRIRRREQLGERRGLARTERPAGRPLPRRQRDGRVPAVGA